MEGNNDRILNLEALEFSYFEKSDSVERKDGLYLDPETISIINELTEDDNPFGIEFPFDHRKLSGAKIVRTGVKLIKENPELLILLDNEVGVDNL